jgi:hypothetical protein
MRGRLVQSLYWLTFGFYFLMVAMVIYLMFRDGARWVPFFGGLFGYAVPHALVVFLHWIARGRWVILPWRLK